jgi:hypothetical protein
MPRAWRSLGRGGRERRVRLATGPLHLGTSAREAAVETSMGTGWICKGGWGSAPAAGGLATALSGEARWWLGARGRHRGTGVGTGGCHCGSDRPGDRHAEGRSQVRLRPADDGTAPEVAPPVGTPWGRVGDTGKSVLPPPRPVDRTGKVAILLDPVEKRGVARQTTPTASHSLSRTP